MQRLQQHKTESPAKHQQKTQLSFAFAELKKLGLLSHSDSLLVQEGKVNLLLSRCVGVCAEEVDSRTLQPSTPTLESYIARDRQKRADRERKEEQRRLEVEERRYVPFLR